jgi:cysteinyl-tRNA synthetase
MLNHLDITIYDTVTQTKVELGNDTPEWYVCGPTVYDDAHLGHARTYIMNDLMVKTVNYLGGDVQHIMNITDVDDKILKRSQETYGTAEKHNELTQKYTQRFLEDLVTLGVELPSTIVKVTDHMDKMIEFVQGLIEKERAYVQLETETSVKNLVNSKGKSVYFDTEKFSDIDTGNKYVFEKAKGQGDFDDKHLKDKKQSADFALWKGVPEDEVGWESPWGRGRPGWHTECAVFINIYGGVDVHTGGVDLCFPHHENEVKQLQSMDTFTPRFMHIGHLHIDGQKMAKSLKNFTTIRSFLENDDGRMVSQLRYMFLQVHYSDPMDFSNEHFEQSKRQLHLLHNIVETIRNSIEEHKFNSNSYSSIDNSVLITDYQSFNNRINEHLTNNFQFSLVLKELHDYRTKVFDYINKTDNPSIHYLKSVKQIYQNIFQLFGLNYNEKSTENNDEMATIITKIRDEVRNQAKQTKNKDLWKLSDVIRDDMLQPLGYQLEDKTNAPSIWKKV